MAQSVSYGKHTYTRDTWIDRPSVHDENGMFCMQNIVKTCGYNDISNLKKNKIWKDFTIYLQSIGVRTDDTYVIRSGTKTEDWMQGSYVQEIFMHIGNEIADQSYTYKVSKLMIMINKYLNSKGMTLEAILKGSQGNLEEMLEAVKPIAESKQSVVEKEKHEVMKPIAESKQSVVEKDITLQSSDTIKISASRSDGNEFSRGTYNGFGITICDTIDGVNFTDVFDQIKENESYKFKDFIVNDNTIWKTIEGFYINGLESMILIDKNKTSESEELSDSATVAPPKNKVISDTIPRKVVKTTSGERSIPDFDSLPHNLTTLEKLGVCLIVKGGSDTSINGSYFRKILLNSLLMKNTRYYCLVVKIMDEFDRRTHVTNETVEEQLEKYKAETDVIIERLEKEKAEITKKYNNSNAGKSHTMPGSILITEKANGYYNVVFKEVNISEDTTVYKSHDTIIRDIYNVNDMRNLFYFYVKNSEFDFIKFVDGLGFEISDMDQLRNFIIDLQHHCFEYDYDVDKCMKKYLKTHNVGNNQFIGNMFEFYCSKKFNIPVYRFGKTESLSLSKIDHGIDLLDVDGRRMGQCKYYKKNHLSKQNLREFLNFCECESFNDWSKTLYVNSDIIIADDVKERKDYEIVYVDETEFDKFMSGIQYVQEQKRVKQKPELTLPCIVDKSIKELAPSTLHKKELAAMDQIEKIRNNPSSALKHVPEEKWFEIRDFVKEILNRNTGVFLDELITTINDSVYAPFTEQMFQQLCSDMTYKDRNSQYPIIDGRKYIKRVITDAEYRSYIEEKIGYGEYYKDEFVKIMYEHFAIENTVTWLKQNFGYMFSGKTKLKRRGDNEVLELIKEDRDEVYNKFFREKPAATMEEFNEYFHRYENPSTWKIIKNKEGNSLHEYKEFVKANINSTTLVKTFNKKFRRGKDNYTREQILALIDDK